jgi:hypothetical protein
MFFQKKKDMVDLRDLPRRSSNLPHGMNFVPKDGAGFVDMTKKRILPSELRKQKMGMQTTSTPTPASNSSSSGFSFFDVPTPTPSLNSPLSQNSSSDTDEILRKISMQISDLDSKIYKIEQRVELLERKAGIVDTGSSSGFNW